MKTVACILCLSIAMTGCTARRVIGKEALQELHGFSGGDAALLRSRAGQRVPFTSSAALALVVRGEEQPAHRYRTIVVKDGLFRGVTLEGEEIRTTLNVIDAAVVYVEDRHARGAVGASVAVVGGFLVIIGTLALIVAALVWINTPTD